MEYTEQQKAEFKEAFVTRRKRQLILAVPLVVIAFGFAFVTDEKNGGAILGVPLAVAAPAFILFLVGGLAFSLRNWRCPACNRYLGKGISPRFCQKCGVALQ